jgi:hypothetical protein
MRLEPSAVQAPSKPQDRLGRLGAAGLLFFLVKGMAWLSAAIALSLSHY